MSAPVYLGFYNHWTEPRFTEEATDCFKHLLFKFALYPRGPWQRERKAQESRWHVGRFPSFSYKLTDKGLGISKASLPMSIREAVKPHCPREQQEETSHEDCQGAAHLMFSNQNDTCTSTWTRLRPQKLTHHRRWQSPLCFSSWQQCFWRHMYSLRYLRGGPAWWWGCDQ